MEEHSRTHNKSKNNENPNIKYKELIPSNLEEKSIPESPNDKSLPESPIEKRNNDKTSFIKLSIENTKLDRTYYEEFTEDYLGPFKENGNFQKNANDWNKVGNSFTISTHLTDRTDFDNFSVYENGNK